MAFIKHILAFFSKPAKTDLRPKHYAAKLRIDLRLALFFALDKEANRDSYFKHSIRQTICMDSIIKSLTIVVGTVKGTGYINLRDVNLVDTRLTTDQGSAVVKVHEVIAKVITGLATEQGLYFDDVPTKGDLQFTKLGHQMLKLDITPRMIDSLLREYHSL